jgi:hypothetical protein
MKPGKYVNHKFTADQKKARAIWRRADEELIAIDDALMVLPIVDDRAELHARLDRRLDAIERGYARAKELFPDVSESFTIASGTMSL